MILRQSLGSAANVWMSCTFLLLDLKHKSTVKSDKQLSCRSAEMYVNEWNLTVCLHLTIPKLKKN